MDSPHSRADSIRSAISSVATCTPITVITLSELLTPPSAAASTTISKRDSKSTVSNRRPLRTNVATQGKPKKPTTNSKPIALHEDQEIYGAKASQTLSPKERAILATEVVNYTLKSLDSAIRTASEQLRRPLPREPKKTLSRQTLRRSISVPHSPLQRRSLERVVSTPNIAANFRRTSSIVSVTTIGPRCAAECARLAFACLRTLQSTKPSCIDLPTLRLENGMSALISRLILLGFDDLAAKELRILKRRLDVSIGSPERAPTRNTDTSSKTTAAVGIPAQPLQELLVFQGTPTDSSLLGLISTTQLQILKLMSSSTKPQPLSATIPHLDVDLEGSPAQILTMMAEQGAAMKAKAAKNLETVSLLILTLIPSAGNLDDSGLSSAKTSAEPDVVFQIQSIAYSMRAMWWKWADHKANVEKDMIEPFSRSLSTFACRSNKNAQATYQLAETNFSRLESFFPPLIGTKSARAPLSAVYKILGSLAQEAGCLVDGTKWITLLKATYQGSSASEVQLCSISARLLSMKLQVAPQDSEIEHLLMAILDGIQGPLRGDSSELDELMLDVTMARKITISIISKGKPSSKAPKTLSEEAIKLCESFLLLCPRFTLRYLGKAPGHGAAPKSIISYEQRQKLVSRFVYPTIDSALYLVKTFRIDGTLNWNLLDSTLQDCLALVEATSTYLLQPADTTKVTPSYLVKLSHLYYNYYLDCQKDTETAKDSHRLRPLRRSVDCVRGGTKNDKSSSFMTMKLERLANLYAALGRYEEARDTMIDLRDELIENGALSAVADCSFTQSFSDSWTHNDMAALLGRTISSLVRFELKASSNMKEVIDEDANWSIHARGMMLEKILHAVSSQTKDDPDIVAVISTALLSLYDAKKYPIRRLRLLTQLLNSETQKPGIKEVVRSTVSVISIEGLVKESNDVGLQRFADHLKVFASSSLELQEDHPRLDLLRQHLTTWSTILDTCKISADLANRVENPGDLICHLQSIADYLELKESGPTRAAVLSMISRIVELDETSSTPDNLILSYTTQGLHYLNLGFSGKAGLILDKAQTQAMLPAASFHGQVRCKLAYAEYLLAIGNSEKCENVLLEAQQLALRQSNQIMSKNKFGSTRLIADASLMHSYLALERGAFTTALTYARKAVRLSYRLWDIVEKQIPSRPSSPTPIEETESPGIALGDEPAPPTASILKVSMPETDGRPSGAYYWPVIPALYRSLAWLSRVYAYHGMYQETLYYAEQAQKVLHGVETSAISAVALTAMSKVWLDSGAVDKAAITLSKAKEHNTSCPTSRNSITLYLHYATLYSHLGDRAGQLAAIAEAEVAAEILMDSKYIHGLDRIVDPTAALQAEMSKLVIATRKSATYRKAPIRGKPPLKKVTAKSKSAVEPVLSVELECLGIRSLKGQLLRHKAEALAIGKQCESVFALLQNADGFSCGRLDSLEQHLFMAKDLLSQGMSEMTADPVYSVLHDSTISFPSVVGNSPTSSSDKPVVPKVSPVRKTLAGRQSKVNASISFFDKLSRSQEHLMEAFALASHASSTAMAQKISSLLNAIILLLSAAGHAKSKASSPPGLATFSIEMSRNIAMSREHNAVSEDSLAEKASALQWPSLDHLHQKQLEPGLHSFTAEVLRFQKDYVDIIPPSWTAVSISLSESKQELCITKLQAGHSPFVVRLPLGRNSSRDVDEEDFDFEQGSHELEDIIKMANDNAHSARNLTGKGAKTAWWSERDTLDARLKELLDNVERVWLGGFRGIFSQHARHTDLLARFQKSFQKILDKHLPSRQKTGRKAKAPTRVTLDPRILELFIGLGDPSAPNADFDEPLTDLLYFIIDILQFHGERNAYDEIDFDSVVVDTLDALRCYHDGVLSSAIVAEDRHTILILDKTLHSFPWESLPCMKNLAISRLPSLSCLRSRLLQMDQLQSPTGSAGEAVSSGHYIARQSGSYILNPSTDLIHTTRTFTALLKPLSLPQVNTIISRAPSESEFSTLLTHTSYLLYFGHGSGTQYIRPKTIRRLKARPAVTMLMGCSSGKLEENGSFENFGTVKDYLLAGSMAVVGNLWDVTDRDCDRFAVGTLEEWGLLEPGAKIEGEDNGRKDKGKSKAKTKNNDQDQNQDQEDLKGEGDVAKLPGRKSLVQAVTIARARCNYRYLTAAAAVVYGIPVYVK